MFQQIIKQTAILIFVLLTIFSFDSQTARAQICKPVTNGLVSWYRAEGERGRNAELKQRRASKRDGFRARQSSAGV
jgi:hypothetical protein